MSGSLEGRLLNIHVFRDENGFAPHKPLLLLLALDRVLQGGTRLIEFAEVDARLGELLDRFAPNTSPHKNTHYPFGKLENDGVWEVENSRELSRTAVGHLLRSELLARKVRAGFTPAFHAALCRETNAIPNIAQALIEKFLPEVEPLSLMRAVGFHVFSGNEGADNMVHDDPCINPIDDPLSAPRGTLKSPASENAFIGYLNSLHNLTASGSNSLAESQALSQYFGELYQPFPVVAAIKTLLSGSKEYVVLLTGHAGDGKSTVALDLFKALQGLPQSQALTAPLGEREDLDTAAGPVRIVKDMSELSADHRQRWLHQAFEEPGRWLIISNTGPLLQSLVEYGRRTKNADMESDVLKLLNRPVATEDLSAQEMQGFGKPLLILNLTRLDNVDLGAGLLRRLVKHSGWQHCQGCDIVSACPLALNRRALDESLAVVTERVRWLYRRVSDYEQRLTLRQIVGQLAYALTGGIGCTAARDAVTSSTASGADRGTKVLQQLLFSEGFFGCASGKPQPAAQSLRAIALLRHSLIGAPVAVDFERGLAATAGGAWAALPAALTHVAALWQRRAGAPEGAPARAALRRMSLIFGRPQPGAEARAERFLDAMLRSPALRDLDAWQQAQEIPRGAQKDLRLDCLHVLLEAYSGFSAAQFRNRIDRLYLTLRRPDRAVVQPAQLIVGTIAFDKFKLDWDAESRLPRLVHRGSGVSLTLSLPLLDYIRRRDAGELPDGLSPIHQAQLDRFQAELLRAAGCDGSGNAGEIHVLRSGIDGRVDISHYSLDEDQQKLVVEYA